MADDKEKATKVEEGDLHIHSIEIPPEQTTPTPPNTEQEKPSDNND